MGIRKPNLSVKEARQLASVRSAASSSASSATDAPLLDRALKSPPPDKRPEQPAKSVGKRPNPSATLAAEQGPGTKPPVMAASQPAGASHAPVQTSSSGTSHRRTSPQVEKIQVFVSAPLPDPQFSLIYTALMQRHGPHKALQMILRKALDQYEKMLLNGTFEGEEDIYPFESDSTPDAYIQTSRMMPKHVVAIARAHFDPLGFESTRAFGRKLAVAALAAFFSKERTLA